MFLKTEYLLVCWCAKLKSQFDDRLSELHDSNAHFLMAENFSMRQQYNNSYVVKLVLILLHTLYFTHLKVSISPTL